LAFFHQLMHDAMRTQELGQPADFPKARNFACSATFIQNFRERHAFAVRRPALDRPPRVTEDEIAQFRERVHSEIGRYPPGRVTTIDETQWKIVPGGFLTWGVKGAESVHCLIGNDAKQGVTVIAWIRTDLSASAWTTTDVMACYFRYLRTELFPEGPILLILDADSAHRAQIARDAARLFNVDLLFIPPGCTDRVQPLDRKVFGVLKAYARQMWRRAYHEMAGAKITKPQMAQHLVTAWSRVRWEVIDSAWSIYLQDPAFEEQSDDDDPRDGDYELRMTTRDLEDLE
jgi:hypothetical protein